MTSKILSQAIGLGEITGNSTNITLSSNGTVQLAANGGTDIFISANDNIGFGNTTPADKLSVQGSLYTSSNSVTLGTAVYISANGNLGIGVSDPGGYKIAAVQDRGRAYFRFDNCNTLSYSTQLDLGAITGKAWSLITDYYANTGDDFSIYQGSSASRRFFIASNGNIGIGTGSPSKTLYVNGDMTVNTNLIVGSYNLNDTGIRGFSNNSIGVYGGSNSSHGVYGQTLTGFGVLGYSNSTGTATLSQVDGSGLALYALANTGVGAQLYSKTGNPLYVGNVGSIFVGVYANGNMGIGTSTPTQKLDVNSIIRASNGTNEVMIAGIEGAIEITRANGANPYIDFKSSMASDYDCRIQQSSNGLMFQTGGQGSAAVRMTIDNAGEVGIGTTTPAYLLDVQTASTAADYYPARLYSAAAASGTSITHLRLEKGNGYGGTVGGYLNQGVSSGLVFSTLNGGTLTNSMWIDHNSNLGVGTTPTYKLHVLNNSNSATTWIGVQNSTAAGAIGSGLIMVSGAGANDYGYVAYANSGYMDAYVRQPAGYFRWVQAGVEKMRLDSSGYLLVNSTNAISAHAQISITGSTTNRGAYIVGRNTAATTGVAGSIQSYSGSNIIASIDFYNNGAVNSGGIQTYTWNAGVSNTGPYLTTGGTNWTAASDENLKDIIAPIENALEKVSALRNVYYIFKNDETKIKRVGFIAQDMEKVLPEVVNQNADGYMGIEYSATTVLLCAAIQELKKQNDDLKTRVSALENK